MKYWLSFMGFPRSGHTLTAAILNANPNVMCSNQLHLYKDNSIDIDRVKSYSQVMGTWKSTTQIPHVPKKEITVVGDKTGHRTVEFLGRNPQKLGIFKNLVKVPIKWIHVVRNPFDNLTTWARLEYDVKMREDKIPTTQTKELDTVIEEYAKLNETIYKLRKSEDVLTVNHEYVITRMHNTLEEICNFLEISFDPEWRDNVRNTVWNKPRITRRQIYWNLSQRKVVQDIIDSYSWLKGYIFGSGCRNC